MIEGDGEKMFKPLNPWDERFSQDEYVYGTEPNVFIKQMASKLQIGEVLAIAEGEGRNAVFLAQQGHRVTTWDFAPSGLEKTRKLAESEKVEVKTELVDLWEATWKEDQWDSIICIFGHFPKELRLKTLQNVKEAVKPGGSFLCEVYSINQLDYKTGGPLSIDMLYRPEDFLQVFKDWDVEHFFFGETERFEGKLHHGRCHVIQFCGKKPGRGGER